MSCHNSHGVVTAQPARPASEDGSPWYTRKLRDLSQGSDAIFKAPQTLANRDNGKENGNYRDYRGLYWGYIGIMEKKMETTILGLYRSSTHSLNSLKGVI